MTDTPREGTSCNTFNVITWEYCVVHHGKASMRANWSLEDQLKHEGERAKEFSVLAGFEVETLSDLVRAWKTHKAKAESFGDMVSMLETSRVMIDQLVAHLAPEDAITQKGVRFSKALSDAILFFRRLSNVQKVS